MNYKKVKKKKNLKEKKEVRVVSSLLFWPWTVCLVTCVMLPSMSYLISAKLEETINQFVWIKKYAQHKLKHAQSTQSSRENTSNLYYFASKYKELKVFPNSNCLCLIIHQAYNTTGFIMFRYNKLPRTNLVNISNSLKV